MTLKKRRNISISLILAFTLLFSSFSFDSVFAVKSGVSEPSKVTTFNSTTTFANEYCKAKVSGSKMTINFRTLIPAYEYRLALYGVYPSTKLNDLGIYIPAQQVSTSSSGTPIYGFQYTIDFSQNQVPDGEYYIYVSKKLNQEDAYQASPSSGAVYKNLPLTINNNIPKILRFNDVIEENNKIQSIGADYDPNWYLDDYLEDIRFVLKIPGTGSYEEMSDYKINFIKQLSNNITSGAYSDYDKLLKIYSYVSSNFYYDTVAFQTHSYQYANPYNNLYNHENRITSSNSDNNGRVATTCQGFSAMFLALARAQKIPTRFVFGHRLTAPLNTWGTEDNIRVRDHWWVESYVNGRWIFIDPTIGTNNRWNKTTNKWQYYGLTNYTYFDPSKEQIASSHIYHNIFPDKRYGYLITNENDITKITNFLEAKSGNDINGILMNDAYSKYDKTTWGDGLKNNFMGDGYGNTTKIRWNDFGFKGDIDFSSMKKLNFFAMRDNKLISANLSKNPKLAKVYLYNNDIETVDLSNCPSLEYVDLSDNPLKTAKIYANKKNVTITAKDNGTFRIKYNTKSSNKLSLTFKPDIGYKVAGFYNGNNKLTTTKNSYSMNPGYRTYKLFFELNPDSYEYYLSAGNNSSVYIPYNRAAQKRLIALGYMSGTASGTFDEDMENAVETFQIANGIAATGTINKSTWSALFSNNAVTLPTEEEIAEIQQINSLKLYASAIASKGKITISWQNIFSDEDYTSSSAVIVDGYQVWRSTKPTTGFTKLGSTKNLKFTNKSGIKKGKTYYYKVRAYKQINSKVYYSQWTQVNVKAK